MRNIKLLLASALMVMLVFIGAASSQPPEPKNGPTRVFRGPSRLGVDDIVERIMAFDKNKDGKVAKDELPERMQDLVAKGDTNKDAALDKDEIKKLATAPVGFGPGGGGGFGIGQAVGPGPGAPGPVTAGFRAGPGLGAIEGIVDDLKLSGKKKDNAKEVVKAHQESVRKLMDQARAELLQKMKEILSEEEFKDFQAALDRPGGDVFIEFGPPEAPRSKR